MNKIESFKNAFINLALPSIMFSEPVEVGKKTSCDFDPILCGAVKAIPDPFTVFDKVIVDAGSLTLQGFIDWMKDNKGVEVQMVTCGTMALYNAYLPGNKHAPRLP